MYINLIGPDGSGKDTQRELLFPYFQDAILTREPGGTEEAEIIREIILNKEYSDDKRMSLIFSLLLRNNINNTTKQLLEKAKREIQKDTINGKAEMYLYAASRSESLEKAVRPAIQSGKHILGNRSVACSIAYQGHARGMGVDIVWGINEPIVRNTHPDIEIFLDIPVSHTMQRLAKRLEKQDRLDEETVDFHEKSREGYLHYYQNLCPYKYAIVNGVGTVDEVHQRILKVIGEV